jgi:hypothetical protein
VGKVRVLGLRRLGGSASPFSVLLGLRNPADERLISGTIYQKLALTTNNCHAVISCSRSLINVSTSVDYRRSLQYFPNFSAIERI